jgi:hypothetical protein
MFFLVIFETKKKWEIGTWYISLKKIFQKDGIVSIRLHDTSKGT